MSNPHSDRMRLADRLRQIRAATGMSGNKFAASLSWQQSRVSKIETGTQMPTADDVQTWLAGANAQDQADEVAELLAAARTEYANWRSAFARVGGAAANQISFAERERAATHIRQYAPGMLPGLLQTADYARDVIAAPSGPSRWGAGPDDLEHMILNRIRRQDLLYDRGKQVQFIIGEAALRTRFGAVETLAAQLDRLTAFADLPAVDLAVIPFATALPVYPLGNFRVHDNNLAMIESIVGEQLLRDPDEIAAYIEFFDLLHSVALTGPKAVEFIRSVAADPG